MQYENKFMTTVKLGSKGQIVIPKEVREMFGLEPGSSLMLLADSERGIALNTTSFYSKLSEQIFSSVSGKDSIFEVNNGDLTFAGNIRQCIEEE